MSIDGDYLSCGRDVLAGKHVKRPYECTRCRRVVEKLIKPTACAACGGESTYVEIDINQAASRMVVVRSQSSEIPTNVTRSRAIRLADCDQTEVERLCMVDCIDHVLGGTDGNDKNIPGAALGTVIQLVGDPGAGKSTLLLSALANVSINSPTLYGAGEESHRQIVTRANRLQIFDGPNSDEINANALIVPGKIIEDFWDEIKIIRPRVAVFDSVQVARSRFIDSEPASPAMVKLVTTGSFDLAHELGDIIIILIFQVIKDGRAAGPKFAEHTVDATLYLSKNEDHAEHDPDACPLRHERLLRAGKNRHGPDTRTARLAMTGQGLVSWSEQFPASATCTIPVKGRATQRYDQETER